MKVWVFVLAFVAAPAYAADYDAVIDWSQRVALSSVVSGVVVEVNAVPGQAVDKGAVLVRFDDTPFKAEVAQAQAQVAMSKVSLAEAQRDLKQAEELYARTVLSTVELENAKHKFARAQAAQRSAQAALLNAEYHLREASLRAPFAALVLKRQVEVGQGMVANLEAAPLVTLARRGEYVAVAAVPESALARLTIGAQAAVRVGDQRYTGSIQSLGLEPSGKAGAATYETRVVFKSDALLRAGQAARVELP